MYAEFDDEVMDRQKEALVESVVETACVRVGAMWEAMCARLEARMVAMDRKMDERMEAFDRRLTSLEKDFLDRVFASMD